MVRMLGILTAIPREIGRHERGLPVIGVNQVRCPVLVQSACRQLGSGRGKSSEADVVVGPVAAGGVAIGVAGAVVELRAEQDIDRQAVPGRRQPERAGRHLRQRRALADDLDMRNCSTTSRYPGSRILTSLSERSARGRAAETAASPPTRTKSSISVVTNKTFKKRPRTSANRRLCKKGSSFSSDFAEGIGRAGRGAAAGRNASQAGRRNLGSRRAGPPRPRELA